MSEVNWREEVLTWSCESEGSGEILYEENGLWSLIRCSPNSSGIIGENSELLPWEKDIAIIGCQYLWPTWTRESIYFTMRFPPYFQLFYFNDRLEFCEFFEWKIKRIDNADLFSQPPLLIFIKGANISGGHCKYVYIYIYIYIYVTFMLIEKTLTPCLTSKMFFDTCILQLK